VGSRTRDARSRLADPHAVRRDLPAQAVHEGQRHVRQPDTLFPLTANTLSAESIISSPLSDVPV